MDSNKDELDRIDHFYEIDKDRSIQSIKHEVI